MRKILGIVLSASLIMTLLAGCGSSSSTTVETTQAETTEAAQAEEPESGGIYRPGTYTATTPGMGGDVTVTITVDENSITDVTIEGENETTGIGTNAIEQMPEMILAAQSDDVDAISEATVTSNAIKTALANCLAQAKGVEAESAERIYTADVLVLGAGGAGLSAALSASIEGASVVVLEAAGVIGGDTDRSAGHITVITDNLLDNNPRNDDDLTQYLDMEETDFPEEYRELLTTLKGQVEEYLDTTDDKKFDSYERIMIDHYLTGYGEDLDGVPVVMDFDLISTALSNVNETWDWLITETALPDTNEYFDTRRVRPQGKGQGLVTALSDAAKEHGAVIYTNTRATKLLTDDSGRVIGATAINEKGEEENYYGTNGVILATGGFQSNGEMASEYQNLWTGVSAATNSTGPETEQGDGIIMAEDVGAALTDMQFVTTIVWGYGGSTLSDENRALQNGMQLLVNKNAERYCADVANISTAANQPDGIFYMVGDSSYYDALGEDQIEDFQNRGILFVGDTLEEVAEKAGLDPETLVATIDTFNTYVDAEEDPDFGRTTFNGKVEEGPFVIVKMESAIHLTLGGVVTDTDAHVLRDDGSVIEGLYAAGDVTGGIEGIVHQSADNMSAVVYFGRAAGVNAAKGE